MVRRSRRVMLRTELCNAVFFPLDSLHLPTRLASHSAPCRVPHSELKGLESVFFFAARCYPESSCNSCRLPPVFTEALYPTGPKIVADAQEKCRKHTKRVEKMLHFLCKLSRNDVESGILRGCRWLIFFALGPCEWQSPKCRRPWPKCWLHHALTLLVVACSFLLTYCLLMLFITVYHCISLLIQGVR